jgi:Rps23 Pro-64 3,4-dihydroxylase Tpa1-like proline 4-hydroxylase
MSDEAGEYLLEAVDDMLPSELWDRLSGYFKNRAAFRYGWYSNKDVSEFAHWHIDFLNKSGAEQKNFEDILYRQPDFAVIAEVWTHLKETYLRGHALVRCYANAHTYGVEGYVHPDTKYPKNFTTLLYIVPEWKAEWAGETVFFNDLGEIVAGVLPKPNKGVIFDGRQLHAARALSRDCPALRVTLMFKTVAP